MFKSICSRWLTIPSIISYLTHFWVKYLSFAVLKEAPEGDAAVRHVQDGLRDGFHHGGIDTEGGTQHPPRLARRRRPRGAGAATGEGRPARRGHGHLVRTTASSTEAASISSLSLFPSTYSTTLLLFLLPFPLLARCCHLERKN